MVMQRGHFEDSFSPQLEAAYLEDDRQKLHHIHSPDEDQEEFIQQMIETHPQPNLLGTISMMTMEAESGVRDELKGILFFSAKNVLDALIDFC